LTCDLNSGRCLQSFRSNNVFVIPTSRTATKVESAVLSLSDNLISIAGASVEERRFVPPQLEMEKAFVR